MQCPTCEQPVAVWAAFCPHCGAAQRPEGESVQATDSSQGPAEPEGSLTDELFAAGPSSSEVPPAWEPPAQQPPAWQPPAQTQALPMPASPATPAYTSGQPGPQEWHTAYEPEERRGGAGRWLVVIAAAAVVLAVVFAAWSLFRTDEGASNASSGQTTTSPRPTTSSTASGQQSPSATSPSASASPSASTPSASTSAGPAPEGSIACGSVGAGPATGVFAADQNTSCPFALAVQKAYAAAPTAGGDVEISATSPVTNKAYTLRCTGTALVTCTADSGATVYLVQQG